MGYSGTAKNRQHAFVSFVSFVFRMNETNPAHLTYLTHYVAIDVGGAKLEQRHYSSYAYK